MIYNGNVLNSLPDIYMTIYDDRVYFKRQNRNTHDAGNTYNKIGVSFSFLGVNIINEIIEKENVVIKNMIYEIREVQVMLDKEMFVTECHYYLYDKKITHYV